MNAYVRPVVESLIDAALDRALADGAVLITANRRQSRAFQATYNRLRLEENKLAWETPLITTFDIWLQTLFSEMSAMQICTQELLSETEELQIWKSIVARVTSRELLSAGSTAKVVAHSWKIERAYGAAQGVGDHYLNQDQRYYRQCCDQFITQKKSHNLVDSASLAETLAPLLAQAKQMLPASLVLTGFVNLTPQQDYFLIRLRDLGVEINRGYEPPRLNGEVFRTPCVDSSAELKCAAHWANKKFSESTGYIGIVVPDLHLRRTEILRTFDMTFFPGAMPSEITQSGRPYDISLGMPLDRYPPIDSALLILALAFDKLSGHDVTRFILSPHLRGSSLERNERSRFDAQLRKDGIRGISAAALNTKCPRTLESLRALLVRIERYSDSSSVLPSVWLERIVNVLRAAGWPGEELYSGEHQAVEAWRDVVEQLGRFDELIGKISSRQMLGVLTDITAQRVFQAQSEDVQIQILGSLEGHGLLFDALWIAGMDNEGWPMPQTPAVFLPMEWQRQQGVPGASAELDVQRARAMVENWRSAAASVVFSHCKIKDGNELIAAKQIAGFTLLETEEQTADPNVSPMSSIRSSIEQEQISDFNGPSTKSEQDVRGGAKLFEDQASCPFKAFVTHRLAVKALEDPVLGLGPREKGIAFHNAIDFFWRDVGNHAGLVAFSEQGLLQKIADCVDEALLAVRHDSLNLLKMEKKRLQALILDWLSTREISRNPFEVLARERNVPVEFESLKLSLQVDRIDQLPDGGVVIIDYKTGSDNAIMSWKEQRITKAQLPLYAVATSDMSVVGICFAQVARGQQKFKGMAEIKNLLIGLEGPEKDCESWPEQIDSWRERLALLAREIQSGVATVTPAAGACVYCPLPGLCRIEQDRIDLQEFAASETGT